MPEPLEGNAYTSGADHLPTTLAEAADLLDKSEIAREQFGDDVIDHYLNYANVELKYASFRSGAGYTVTNIEGRTIHPDGKIIPFTGKPYEKLIERTQGYQGYKAMSKVFTMPDVEVGSILEYRYTLRYDDNYYYSPDWYGEALGVVALRRVVGGHAWRAMAGVGRQRSADEDWKRARKFEVGYESPRWRRSWLRVSAGYTDTPVATSTGTGSYSYRYLALESGIAF